MRNVPSLRCVRKYWELVRIRSIPPPKKRWTARHCQYSLQPAPAGVTDEAPSFVARGGNERCVGEYDKTKDCTTECFLSRSKGNLSREEGGGLWSLTHARQPISLPRTHIIQSIKLPRTQPHTSFSKSDCNKRTLQVRMGRVGQGRMLMPLVLRRRPRFDVFESNSQSNVQT